MSRSHLTCYHPLQQRRRYDDLWVCRECMSVKVGDSAWQPVTRWIQDGRLLAIDGTDLGDWNHIRTNG